MKRRDFITVLGGTAVMWPLTARAQQPRMPVVGFLVSASATGSYVDTIAATRQGLSDAGFSEGRNVAIEYRWANEQYDRLPALAADLVQRQVTVIYATGSVMPAVAAQAATRTIPIVFAHGSDPVKFGLVANLARPGGNVTGISFYNNALVPKRLELLRELFPKASVIAILVNPNNPNAESDIKNVQSAAQLLGLQMVPVPASREGEFDAAFAKIVDLRADALLVATDALFQGRRDQLIALAARHAVPAMYAGRVQTEAGGLISYGPNTVDMARLAGVYIARILKGDKPADLPVMQPTKFELIVNLKTAKALGLTIPESFLLRCDEVIE
jgi:putative ABC transport system substrate-binding protein